MTDDELIAAFCYGHTRLRVNDGGLADDNDPADLDLMAALSLDVIRATAAGDTPLQLSLNWLAITTGALLASPWLGDGHIIVRKYLIARAEVIELKLGAQG